MTGGAGSGGADGSGSGSGSGSGVRPRANRAPAQERLAWRGAGLAIAVAGASLLGWTLWRGSRPVEGLQRGGAEWLVPAAEVEAGANEGGGGGGHAPVEREASAAGGAGDGSAVVGADGADGPLTSGPSSAGGRDEDAGAPAVPLVIDINIATAAQFELLPDIGPTLAQRIVDDREANGRFATPEDLMRVRGIGPKTLEGMRGLIVCGGE